MIIKKNYNNKLLILGQLPPPVHGSNVMAQLFCQTLGKFGYQVDMVQKTFSRDMHQVERFSMGKVIRIFTIGARLVQALIKAKPRLCFYFITVKFRAFIIDALFLAIIRLFKVPYILYCHGKGLRALGSSRNPVKNLIVRGTLKKAAGALVLGELLREDLSPFLAPERILVLPNAVPDQAGDRALRRERQNPKVQVLFLSNLVPSKGPLEFLHIAKEVAARVPEVQFFLAGPPVNEAFYRELLDFIARENLADRVEVPGGLFGESKMEVFRKSDIFVYPTQRDAFPLVILEAMQWGLPVISSDEGAIPELVVDGVTGYIVNPKDIGQLTDRVLRLIKDPELRRRMGEAGRKRYEECFSIEAYQKNLVQALDFFQNLLPNLNHKYHVG